METWLISGVFWVVCFEVPQDWCCCCKGTCRGRSPWQSYPNSKMNLPYFSVSWKKTPGQSTKLDETPSNSFHKPPGSTSVVAHSNASSSSPNGRVKPWNLAASQPVEVVIYDRKPSGNHRKVENQWILRWTILRCTLKSHFDRRRQPLPRVCV